MPIPEEAYKSLENVVGSENISDDPAIVSSYLYTYSLGQPSKWLPEYGIKFDAVVLPATTREVQAVVRICNRYNIKFKAHSTGWGSHAVPWSEGSILIDLRRMNRIVKIDDRNMYAVVEPYVSWRELQAEAMKMGLTCHVIGAGGQCSVLASTTSMMGQGQTGVTTGFSSRNLLGFELVTAAGEIIRAGLVDDEKAGMPGIDVRGLIRGYLGAAGGIGVFTKAAVKLHPWPGPQKAEVTGENPSYGWRVPENFHLSFLVFPDGDKLMEAFYKLMKEEICYFLWHYSPFSMVIAASTSTSMFYELWKGIGFDKREVLEKEGRWILQLIIAAFSDREKEYKMRVLKDVMEETDAREWMPGITGNEEVRAFAFTAFIQAYRHGLIFRSSAGSFETSFGPIASIEDSVKKVWLTCHRVRKPYIDQKKFVDDGFENMWGGPYENFYSHLEGLFCEDMRDEESVKAVAKYTLEAIKADFETKTPGSGDIMMAFTAAVPKEIIEGLSNFTKWTYRIKRKIFDPKGLAEGWPYLTMDDLPGKLREFFREVEKEVERESR